MRIRILDRILVSVAGVILVASCVGVAGQVFFGKDVTGFIAQQLNQSGTTAKIVIGAATALLLLLGLYCVMLLFRHRKRNGKFILQRMENGDLAISLTTLETMVQKCLELHPEIKAEQIRMENQRNGLLIRIKGTVSGGISIPLTVDMLQKQIKQYVTACSGVEVKGIQIEVEPSGQEAGDAPFAIDAPTSNLLPKGTETRTETASAPPDAFPEIPTGDDAGKEHTPAATEPAETASAPENPAEAASAAVMAAAQSIRNDTDEEDDRPLHQRLFSTVEEPCIMPMPPKDLCSDQEKPSEEAPEAEKEMQTGNTGEILPAPDGRPPEQKDEKGEEDA